MLQFLDIGAFLAVFAAWFCILFTGRFPKGLHGYVAGVGRWNLRVQAYMLSLTDEYPPYSLSGLAGSAGKDSYVISSIVGGLMFAGYIALFATGVIGGFRGFDFRQTTTVHASYSQLKTGQETEFGNTWQADISLTRVEDPVGREYSLTPRSGERYISFYFDLRSDPDYSVHISDSEFRLEDANGNYYRPVVTSVSGRAMPTSFKGSASGIVMFSVPSGSQVANLRYRPVFGFKQVVFEFR